MIGYKLLQRDPDTKLLYSFLAGSVISRGVRTCYRGITSPRKGSGPLCVFMSRELAVEFVVKRKQIPAVNGPTPAAELWEVNYKPSYGSRIWDTQGHERKHHGLPDGTALARTVTLIKLIDTL